MEIWWERRKEIDHSEYQGLGACIILTIIL
jgi:hypothetical protein